MKRKLYLKLCADIFGIVRLPANARMPEWLLKAEVYSVTRTEKELTIVCSISCIPNHYQINRNWRCLKVEGSFDFGEVGIIASIASALSENGISIYVFSAYDTDYILIQEESVENAIKALKDKGHSLFYETKRLTQNCR